MNKINWTKFANTWHLDVNGETICFLNKCEEDLNWKMLINVGSECDPVIDLEAPDIEDAKHLALIEVARYYSNCIEQMSNIASVCLAASLAD